MYIFIGAAIANNDCVNNITHNKINQNRNANAQFMFIWVNRVTSAMVIQN
jgi:hypothetical protein